MLDTAREAMFLVQDRSHEDLNHDRQLVLALIKDIEIVGVAVTQVAKQLVRIFQRYRGSKLLECATAWFMRSSP